jgi:diacylglycerol O-acyltransferase
MEMMESSQPPEQTIRLSGYDAMFVLSEHHEPQHTLKIAVFDEASSKSLQFARISEALTRALAVVPQMRWRAESVPFGLNRPVWIVDPDFDVGNHLRHARLPRPGTKTQLCHMIGDISAEPIPPDQPPWQFWFLEGFEGTKLVGVLKLSHAMADGGTCAELLDMLSRPEPGPLPVPAPVPRPIAPASRGAALREGVRDLWHELRREVPRMVRTTRLANSNAGRPPLRRPPRFGTPKVPWRGPLTPGRTFSWVSLSLGDVKEIAKVVSGTVNDVVLAVVAGAVRECLADAGMSTDRPVVANTVAKNRKEGDIRLWGNAVTVRSFELPTHLADPLERLREAHLQSASVKARVASRPVQVVDWVNLVPPILMGPVLRLLRVPAQISGGVVVSNVKGPKEKRYIGKLGIENFISCGHMKDAAGINVTVWSYDKLLNFAVCGCSTTLPDAEVLTQRIQSSFDELRAAAGASWNLAGNGPDWPKPARLKSTAAEGIHHV